MSRTLLVAGATFAVFSATAHAALPSYPTPGVVNPDLYSFTKQGDGDFIAFFVGASASLTNFLGVIAGGTDLGTGLSNADPLGTAFNYGFVADGTDLEFYINTGEGNTFFTDPALNADGITHAFSAPYGGGDTIGITNFPAGTYTYVGFEDLLGGGDLDYDDINFVFESTVVNPMPEPGALALMLGGLGLDAGLRASRNR